MQIAATTGLWIVALPVALAQESERKLVDGVSPLANQSLLETSSGLLLVLLLILAIGWLFKRFVHQPLIGKGLVAVQGGVSVGPRERVVVIKVDGVRLLLGVAPGQVTKLLELGSEETPAADFQQQLDSVKSPTADVETRP